MGAGDRKKQIVLDAVLQVIAKEGVDCVTHRRVGAAAGVSHGVVSYHFPTRDDLLLSSFGHHLGQVEDYNAILKWNFSERMSKHRIIDNLCTAISHDMAGAATTRVEQELILYASRRPEFAAVFRKWEQKVVDVLADSLRRARCRNPILNARILLSLSRGFLLESLTDPSLKESDFRQRAKAVLGVD